MVNYMAADLPHTPYMARIWFPGKAYGSQNGIAKCAFGLLPN